MLTQKQIKMTSSAVTIKIDDGDGHIDEVTVERDIGGRIHTNRTNLRSLSSTEEGG